MDIDRELKRLEKLFFTERFSEQKNKLKEISAKIEKNIEKKMAAAGMTIPDHTLINEFEMDVQLSDFTEGKRSLIFFYRGSWCPYSNVNVEYLMNHSDHIKNKGYNILVISNSLPEEGVSLSERVNLPISVLSDQETFLAEALGITYELTPEIEAIYERAGIIPDTGTTSKVIYPVMFIVDGRRNIKRFFIRSDEMYIEDISSLMD